MAWDTREQCNTGYCTNNWPAGTSRLSSPAEMAGLRGGDRVVTIDGSQVVLGGDVIIAVDNTQIEDAQDIEAELIDKTVGDVIEFSVIRGSSTQEVEVELGAR